MTTRILPTAAMLACIFLSSAAAAEKDEEGFVSIFNGRDLSGWEGEEGFWSVENGAITGTTTAEKPIRRSSFLRWRGGKVADFELRFLFRILAGNSGMQFRSRELDNWDVAGYQADFDAPNQWTGCLYDCNSHRADPNRVIGPLGQKVAIDTDGKRTGTVVGESAELLKHVKKDDWNEYHVIARGPLVTLKINGQITSQVSDHEKGKAARSGIIAIQLHGGEPMKVQVKDLRVKHLK